jgi:hypothetical protein
MAKAKQYVPGKRTAQQNKAIHDKAQEMMGDGYEPQQAIAIAFRMFRDGELALDIAMAPQLDDEAQDIYDDIKQERYQGISAFESARRSAINRYKRLLKLKTIKRKSQ